MNVGNAALTRRNVLFAWRERIPKARLPDGGSVLAFVGVWLLGVAGRKIDHVLRLLVQVTGALWVLGHKCCVAVDLLVASIEPPTGLERP